MSYLVSGLDPAPFLPLFGLSDPDLAAQGVIRVIADTDGFYPCRVSLADAAPGQSLLLLNHEHQPAATPYRARHAIFVSEAAREACRMVDRMPAILVKRRLVSLRAYDQAGMMLDGDVVAGPDVEARSLAMLALPGAAYVHAHNPGRGCYAARIERV